MNNVLLFESLMHHLQSNPELLLPIQWSKQIAGAEMTIAKMISLIDSNSLVLPYLMEQIVGSQFNLIKVTGGIIDDTVRSLQTMKGWCPEMVHGFISNNSGLNQLIICYAYNEPRS